MVAIATDLSRAARNVWAVSFGDGIEPYLPAPSTPISEEPHNRLQAFDRELTRPLFIARHAADTEALARMEAVDRFMATMPGYPGRSLWQIYRSLVLRNELADGTIRLRSDLVVELAKLTCRVLLIGSRTDMLVPARSVRRGPELLTGASEVRFTEVTGGHLGLMVGPQAAVSTWPAIGEFLGD